MQIYIHSVRFDAEKKLINFINKKMKKLIKFDDELISSDVFLRIENSTDKSNKLVEVKINSGFKELFASKKRETFEEAVDNVQEILIRLVKKNKQKKTFILVSLFSEKKNNIKKKEYFLFVRNKNFNTFANPFQEGLFFNFM